MTFLGSQFVRIAGPGLGGLNIPSRPGSSTAECGSSLILFATGVCSSDSMPEVQLVNSAPAATPVTAEVTFRKLRRVRSSFFMTVTIPPGGAAINRWLAAISLVLIGSASGDHRNDVV